MNRNIINSRTQQHGSSLLETMISLFVLAIGLLGTLAMQNKSIQHNRNSFVYTQAIVMATDLNERLRISADPVAEFETWKSELEENIPGGTATFDGVAAIEIEEDENFARGRVRTIAIQFTESSAGLRPEDDQVDDDILKKTISFNTWL